MKPSTVVAGVTAAILAYFAASLWNEPGACHLLHLASPPDDLYAPAIVRRNASFGVGSSVELAFEPQYCDLYTIGFEPSAGAIAQTALPDLRVVAEIEHDGDPVASFDLERPTVMRLGRRSGTVRRVEYGLFGLPSSSRPVRIGLRISAADAASAEVLETMDLVVVVSASP